MLKVALIGAVVAAFGFSGFSIGDLFLFALGAGVALMFLGVVLEVGAAILERLNCRWSGFRLASNERLQRSGS